MRCCSRLQSLHQTQLRARSKVRVGVRTLLGTVSELRLYSLDGVPTRYRLARDRVAPSTELPLPVAPGTGDAESAALWA